MKSIELPGYNMPVEIYTTDSLVWFCFLTLVCMNASIWNSYEADFNAFIHMLKNDQKYFKNLVVFTLQDFYIILGHFSIFCMKGLKRTSINSKLK